ncbi:hypothetical protein OQX61_00665 [Pedobacter sp. PLR]|uniref:hypothetical protein n=1 Tax=Pedobacter sp. PLR TaxID=2994465 RepID=UPI002246092F|nr:hypothetical protein [Pedobacter sp. PLR]MCX2449766.1 hypothetical protein [Pedobacter sp. PLR]
MLIRLLRNEWIKCSNDKALLFILFLPAVYPWYFVFEQYLKTDIRLINDIDSGQNDIRNIYLLLYHKIYITYVFLILPLSTTFLISFYGRTMLKKKELSTLMVYPAALVSITKSKLISLCALVIVSGIIFYLSTQTALFLLFKFKPQLSLYIITLSVWDVFSLTFLYQLIFIFLSLPVAFLCYIMALKFRYAILLNLIISVLLLILGLLNTVLAKISLFIFPFKYYMNIAQKLRRDLVPPAPGNIPLDSIWLLSTVIFTMLLSYLIHRMILNYEDK